MSITPAFCYHNQVIDNKPKVIVFDIGGVLLNWKAVIPEVSQILNITPETFFDELQTHLKKLEIANTHQNDFWLYLTDKYNNSIDSDLLKKTWIEKQTRIESAWDLLKKVKASGYRVVCCTNNWKDTVEKQLELHPDFSLFEFILNSADVGVRKPDGEIYKIVEEKVGESGKDMFLIDDLKSNCEGAEKIGWQTFIFDSETDNGSKDAEIIAEMLEIN